MNSWLRYRNREGNIFASIIFVLFILTLIFASVALYVEKEKVIDQYFADKDRLEQEKEELKEKIYKEKKDREKKDQELFSLKTRYAELEARYNQLESNYREALDLKQFLAEKLADIARQSKEKLSRLDRLHIRLDEAIDYFSSGEIKAKQKNDKRGPAKKTPEGEIELPTVVVSNDKEVSQLNTKDSKTAEKKLFEAQIMSINPQHNFAVINKGVVDGVEVGNEYKIIHAGEKIAVLKISELRDFVALGMIKDLRGGVRINVGDKVTPEVH